MINNDITLTIHYHLGYFSPKDITGYSMIITPYMVTLRTYYLEFCKYREDLYPEMKKSEDGRYYVDQVQPYNGIPFDDLIVEATYAFGTKPTMVLDADGTTVEIEAYGEKLHTYMPFNLVSNGLFKFTKELVKLIKGFKIPPFLSGSRSKHNPLDDVKNNPNSTHIARMINRKIENFSCIQGAMKKLNETKDLEEAKELDDYIKHHEEDNMMCDREIEYSFNNFRKEFYNKD